MQWQSKMRKNSSPGYSKNCKKAKQPFCTTPYRGQNHGRLFGESPINLHSVRLKGDNFYFTCYNMIGLDFNGGNKL